MPASEPSPHLVAEVAGITRCNMRMPQNLGTLRRWRKLVGEDEIVERLVLFNYHFQGSRTRSGEVLPRDSRRWLATWEWQCFGDPMAVAGAAGVL
jgi:hypothetical protein